MPAMWIPALLIFGTAIYAFVWCAITFWPITLIVLVMVITWKALFGRPEAPAPVRAPVRKPVPAPVLEPPAPGYLRKWNSGRRADAVRELAVWQETFDRSIPPGRGSTMGVARPRR